MVLCVKQDFTSIFDILDAEGRVRTGYGVEVGFRMAVEGVARVLFKDKGRCWSETSIQSEDLRHVVPMLSHASRFKRMIERIYSRDKEREEEGLLTDLPDCLEVSRTGSFTL